MCVSVCATTRVCVRPLCVCVCVWGHGAQTAQTDKASYPPPMLLAHWPPIRDIQMVPMVFSNGAPPMLLSHWRSLEGIKWVPMVFANGSKALGKSIGFSI